MNFLIRLPILEKVWSWKSEWIRTNCLLIHFFTSFAFSELNDQKRSCWLVVDICNSFAQLLPKGYHQTLLWSILFWFRIKSDQYVPSLKYTSPAQILSKQTLWFAPRLVADGPVRRFWLEKGFGKKAKWVGYSFCFLKKWHHLHLQLNRWLGISSIFNDGVRQLSIPVDLPLKLDIHENQIGLWTLGHGEFAFSSFGFDACDLIAKLTTVVSNIGRAMIISSSTN